MSNDRTHARPAYAFDDEGRVALEYAEKIGHAIAVVLGAACERIELAGSIRRRRTWVKDIELVAIPRVRRDLFGEVVDEATELCVLVDELIASGRLAPRVDVSGRQCMGRKHKRLTAVRSGIAIDLFAVLPPAEWGAIFTIRTGPAEYSERLVTKCKLRGLRCEDGRLITPRGRTVPTPEERDFIRECGLEYVEPWERR